MKRTLICWMVALSMGVLASHAQTENTRKEQNNSSTKAAEPKPGNTPPAPPSLPALPTPRAGTNQPTAAKEVAVVKTSMGEMVLEFWPEVAPKHVENFKKLARQGFYDGVAFHRVIKNFMIQGGDPNTKDESKRRQWGQGGPGYMLKAEFSDRRHTRGVLSMARSPAGIDTAGSQFFIVLANAPHLDGQYTAFGKLIKGDDVLGRIGDSPTDPGDVPLTRVNIEKVTIVPADSLK